MRNWSIPAGRIFGVEIRIHLTFLFLLVFVWLTDSASHATVTPGRGLALVGNLVTFRHSLPLENLNINEIESPLALVTTTADQLERALTGGDRF